MPYNDINNSLSYKSSFLHEEGIYRGMKFDFEQFIWHLPTQLSPDNSNFCVFVYFYWQPDFSVMGCWPNDHGVNKTVLSCLTAFDAV